MNLHQTQVCKYLFIDTHFLFWFEKDKFPSFFEAKISIFPFLLTIYLKNDLIKGFFRFFVPEGAFLTGPIFVKVTSPPTPKITARARRRGSVQKTGSAVS